MLPSQIANGNPTISNTMIQTTTDQTPAPNSKRKTAPTCWPACNRLRVVSAVANSSPAAVMNIGTPISVATACSAVIVAMSFNTTYKANAKPKPAAPKTRTSYRGSCSNNFTK
jgi:hypothetical protein